MVRVFAFVFLRWNLAMEPRLALNTSSSYLTLLSSYDYRCSLLAQVFFGSTLYKCMAGPGVVAHICNLSTLEVKAGRL
jgi:hypothetical protein